jgi:hypothetical protein
MTELKSFQHPMDGLQFKSCSGPNVVEFYVKNKNAFIFAEAVEYAKDNLHNTFWKLTINLDGDVFVRDRVSIFNLFKFKNEKQIAFLRQFDCYVDVYNDLLREKYVMAIWEIPFMDECVEIIMYHEYFGKTETEIEILELKKTIQKHETKIAFLSAENANLKRKNVALELSQKKSVKNNTKKSAKESPFAVLAIFKN